MKIKKYIIKYKWWEFALTILLLILSFLSFLSIWKFYNIFKNTTISTDPNDWADFGSYIGGVLGPLFALMTTIITIWLTIIINNLSKANTEIQIEAEKRIAQIQLKQEALKEFRSELSLIISEWGKKINDKEMARKFLNALNEFETHNSHLFQFKELDIFNLLKTEIEILIVDLDFPPDWAGHLQKFIHIKYLYKETISKLGKKVIE